MNKTDELPLICQAYDFASELSHAEPDPRGWTGLLVRMFQKLESETNGSSHDPAHSQAIQDSLTALRDAISNRLETGHW